MMTCEKQSAVVSVDKCEHYFHFQCIAIRYNSYFNIDANGNEYFICPARRCSVEYNRESGLTFYRLGDFTRLCFKAKNG